MRRRVLVAYAATVVLGLLLCSCGLRLLCFRQTGWALLIDLERGRATRVPAVTTVDWVPPRLEGIVHRLAWLGIEIEDIARGRAVAADDPRLAEARAAIARRHGGRAWRRAIWWMEAGSLDLHADGDDEPELSIAMPPVVSP